MYYFSFEFIVGALSRTKELFTDMSFDYPLQQVDVSEVFARDDAGAMAEKFADGSVSPSVKRSECKQVLSEDTVVATPGRKRPSSARKADDSDQRDVVMKDVDDADTDKTVLDTEEEAEGLSPPAKKRLLAPSISTHGVGSESGGSLLPLPSPSASPTQSDSVQDVFGSKDITLRTADVSEGSLNDSQKVQQIYKLIQNLSPGSLQAKYALWMLLQRTDRATLSSLQKTIRQALRKDIVQSLPSEIAYKIFAQFDFRTLLRTSEVCRGWVTLSQDGSADFWKNMLFRDNLVKSEVEYEAEKSWIHKLRPMLTPGSLAKLLYKRRMMIGRRWKNTAFQPRRITLPGQGLNVITCLQFDEDKIAAGSDDSSITIYDTQTGKLRTVLSGHNGGVWAMKYYKNTLASGSTDRTVRIWNIKRGKCTHIFRGHISTVRCLDIIEPRQIGTDDLGRPIVYPKDPLLITGSRDATLFVWKLPLAGEDDPVSDEPIDLDEHSNKYLIRVLKGHTGSVRAVTGYANILISGSYDTSARVWDLRTGECKFVLSGHADRIYSCVYDVDRNQCYTGSVDNTVRIWDLSTGKCKSILEGHQMLVGLITSSKHSLVSAAADWTVRIWDPDTGQPRSVLRGHNSAITCVQNDDYVIISGSQGMLKLWNAQTGEFIRDLLNDVDGAVWQAKFDYRRCIAAVQKDRRTCIEILDFCPPGTDYWAMGQ
ncbi:hypothetical protein FOA43_004670 [Brettanomyces nanus]|uniref:F-box domain-containing protein n=1 Tax=Eeniella nana TaxID=13502 RepID=A0A875SC47_EENNA|nr:uncharacterized protein FOA43_004670 [Brettanomyces nanus]QPG77262.1 hypothetical protein FOA43_004670 [Brettanomyces nanus]